MNRSPGEPHRHGVLAAVHDVALAFATRRAGAPQPRSAGEPHRHGVLAAVHDLAPAFANRRAAGVTP